MLFFHNYDWLWPVSLSCSTVCRSVLLSVIVVLLNHTTLVNVNVNLVVFTRIADVI